MKISLFLPLFIIFLVVLSIKRHQQTHAQQNANEAFLERERTANATRKQDISGLDYLPFSADALPVGEFQDDELAGYEETLTKLSEKKIINLSSMSNTDLKLMYGPANFNDLSEYDENYHTLSSALLGYAQREEALNRTDAAVTILEYAMSLAIDSSQIYLLLAKLYQKRQTPEKIQTMIDTISTMDESFRTLVLPKLESFRIDE